MRIKKSMIDLRQTKEYADYLRLDGWTVETVEGVNYFLKKLPIVGYILKLQRPEEVRYKDIEILSAKYKVFQAFIEPKNDLQVRLLASNGFKLSKNTYLPSKTLQIDLTKSKKEIYADLQRNIRVGVKRGEGFLAKEHSTPDEIKTFREVWKKSVNYNRYVPHLKSLLNLRKSFPGKKSLFLASHNISGRIIGGVIFTISSHERSNYITYYNYGFISNEGRSSLSMSSLLYQGILWGKRMGCKVFDFEGIYDDRFPQKSWLGFSRFKKSFGGYEVLYPGCYTKYNLKNVFSFKAP